MDPCYDGPASGDASPQGSRAGTEAIELILLRDTGGGTLFEIQFAPLRVIVPTMNMNLMMIQTYIT